MWFAVMCTFEKSFISSQLRVEEQLKPWKQGDHEDERDIMKRTWRTHHMLSVMENKHIGLVFKKLQMECK